MKPLRVTAPLAQWAVLSSIGVSPPTSGAPGLPGSGLSGETQSSISLPISNTVGLTKERDRGEEYRIRIVMVV